MRPHKGEPKKAGSGYTPGFGLQTNSPLRNPCPICNANPTCACITNRGTKRVRPHPQRSTKKGNN